MKTSQTAKKNNKNLLALLSSFLTIFMVPGVKAAEERTYFINPFAGYTFLSSSFTLTEQNSLIDESLKIKSNQNYGLILGVNTSDPGNIFLLFSQQDSQLNKEDSKDSFSKLNINYLHLGGSLYFPTGNWEPYFSASVGLTHLTGGSQQGDETRFSMGVGVGSAYNFSRYFALTADLRTFATFVNSDHTFLCHSVQCTWQIEAQVMWQAQANIGLKFSF